MKIKQSSITCSKVCLFGVAVILSSTADLGAQQPDLRYQMKKPIKTSERGNNHYGIEKTPVISLPSKSSSKYRGRFGRVVLKLQNDGPARGRENFRLVGSGSNRKYGVLYSTGSRDVSEQVRTGSFEARLQGYPNYGTETIYLTIKPRKGNGKGQVRVTGHPLRNPARTDTIVVPVRIRK